jgi:tRNA(Ile)-lysidine synthase
MSKFESSPVVKQFRNQCNEHRELCEHVIAGISGGPDSMALLYLLHRTGIRTTAVHCNYGVRGKASDNDQELVEKMCGLWGFECISVRLNFEEEEGGNFQNWARDRRYGVFRDLLRETDTSCIATAHHSDDQIETILQKILRGSGPAAWKGISVSDGELFRPLLGVSRQEIMQFVQAFNIPYRIDRTNEESTYARNFLRLSWFPELDKLFPGWKDNLLRMQARAAEYEGMAGHILSTISEHPERLSRPDFLSLSPEIRPVILYSFIERSGAGVSASASFLEASGGLEDLQSGGRLPVSGNISILRDRDLFILVTGKNEEFHPVVLDQHEAVSGKMISGFSFTLEQFGGFNEPGTLFLDASKTGFPLTIRRWNDGDGFTPLGMTGRQLVSDHLTNRKISSADKGSALVAESFDGTISAVIFPHKTSDGQIGTISDRVRCGKTTKQVLTIRKN